MAIFYIFLFHKAHEDKKQKQWIDLNNYRNTFSDNYYSYLARVRYSLFQLPLFLKND